MTRVLEGVAGSPAWRALAGLLLVTVALGAGASVAITATPERSIEPIVGGWPIATPEAHGWDSRVLAAALLEARERGIHVHSVLLVQGGDLVLDAYLYPYDGATVHQVASVTKSITPTLVAMASEQGLLSLDDPIISFFPDRTIANLDGRKERITLRHLASMSSGLACDADGDERTLQEMKASEDWVQFALDLPTAAEPGTRFSYCSPGMHLLSAALQGATGMTEEAFAREHLFGPLGITDLLWQTDPQGYTRGWADLYLQPRDAARLGQLWLRHGEWDGVQLVSSDWLADSVTVHARVDGGDDYGYGWWLPRETVSGEHKAVGRGGQHIAVHPALDLVLVMTGGGYDPGRVIDLLEPALVSPGAALPDDPAGRAELAAALATITRPPAARPVPPLPPVASSISGATWDFDPNPRGIATARLDFPAGPEAALEIAFSNGQPTIRGRVGLDGVLRFGPGRDDLPAGLRGTWTDATTFAVEWDQVTQSEAFDLHFRFDGDRLTLDGRERSHEGGFVATAARRS